MIRRMILRVSKSTFAFIFLFFYFLRGFSGATSEAAPEPKQDQIKVIESKLSRERQKFEEFDFQEKDLLGRLADLEKEVAEKRNAIAELRKKIHLAKNEVKRLEKRVMDLGLSLSNTEMQMAKRLVVLYKYARKGYIKALANVTDLDQFWQRVKYLKAIMQEDRDALVRLDEEIHSYKAEISQTKEQLVEKEAIDNEKKTQLLSLRKDLEKKVIHLMKIHKEKEFYQTAVMELQLAAKNLKQTLLNIEKKESYKTTGFRFGDSKGKLYLPLEGKVVKGEGFLGSARVNSHKGIFIESSTDNRVKAVFPGRIDFSGRLKGYGEIIIINHGSRFFTISARLYQRKKEEGDLVKGGEVIGLVGDNRLSKGSRLYFEIRRGEKNLDPFEWLKVR